MNLQTADVQDRPRKRILFVDDEASIRLTLPPVLEQAGFEVHVAETVGDAIFEINSCQFDILISDLNIGDEGDGFLVTSAMRHIQPNCVTFILTGYPAFETALQAIHGQVDDYLVKPVEVPSLIATLNERLSTRGPKLPAPVPRLSGLLNENAASIVRSAVRASSRDASQGSKPDKDTAKYFRAFLQMLAEQIDHDSEQISADGMRLAAEYGKSLARQKRGSAAVLAQQLGNLEIVVYNFLQRDLTSAEGTLTLVADLRMLATGFNRLLNKSLESFERAVSSRSRK
jgi:ActR/RegA family two-component response regulator